MSEDNVVHRKEKKNLRKSTDGYRTDSGCFEDVDVPLTNQNPSTSTSSESVNLRGEKLAGTDPSPEEYRLTPVEYRLSTECTPDPCPHPSSIADECADDKDFHAILKRLSDLTTNPGDLYRLCFGSRLSFCGHMSCKVESEEPNIDGSSKSVTIQENEDEDSVIPMETVAKLNAERSSNEQQCVELLSLISSLMKKVQENPNFFKQSGLGNSLAAHLSSLLPALEDSKRNEKQSHEHSNVHCGLLNQCISLSTTSRDDEHKSCVIREESEPVRDAQLNENHDDDPSQGQNATQILPVGHNAVIDEKLGPYHAVQLLSAKQEEKSGSTYLELETDIPKTDSILNVCPENQNKHLLPFPKRDGKLDGNSGCMGDLLESHDKLPFASTEKEVFQTTLPVASFIKDPSNLELYNCYPDLECQTDDRCETPSLLIDKGDSLLNVKLPQSQKTDDADPNLQQSSDEVDHPAPQKESKDNISIPNVDYINAQSNNETADSRDVVMNGRRAVKPYSWDYGDIWEKELERARSSEAFLGDSAREMMPSFEEIRDELFHNAGFLYDNSDRSVDASKRRSRSADGRPSLPDDISPEPVYCGMPNEVHSPFVRTVYQDENRPSTGLRRSWSSNHIGNNSVLVNVDWERGRQVITGSSGQGFDSVHAQIIREAVVKSSTFRGSKPWSALKRRPSGLRRRSVKNEMFHSKHSEQSRGKIDNDSESSDSPYVSATSSDCLTSATDDSSSVTSSPTYATSSLPSSPSVSNRSSACFSDTSTSDASDIRRVVFQNSPSELSFRGHYAGGYNALARRGMTLNERFREIEIHFGISPKEKLQMKGVEIPLVSVEIESRNVRENSCNFPRQLQGDNLMSPLLVRSDSELNSLTKVEFVGDSYSRSRISKNLRHIRNRSQSPLPVGPSSGHTRVVSCEIVQSDNGKQDVYTKVNIADSLDDGRDRKFHNGWNNKMGYPSSRRSWHGQSSTRASHRYYPTKNIAGRYTNPLCSSSHQRYANYSKIEARCEKPVSATLVSVNNHKNKGRTHWSTGSLRMPPKEEPCRSSNKVTTKRSRSCGHSTSNIEFSPHFEKNFQGYQCRNHGRDQSVSRQSSDVNKLRSGRPRSPLGYVTTMGNSHDLQKQENRLELSGNEKHFADKDFPRSNSLMERDRLKAKPKERLSHIVKETSFVGPSTFTKYQSSSNPSLTQTRRSRSLNDRDAMSRQRLPDTDIYRRAMEINHSDGEYLSPDTRYDSNVTAMHRLDRRRRYSEGASCRLRNHEFSIRDGVVDSSYCDPRRESIREGTYSIVNAESAREKTDSIHQTKGGNGSSKRDAHEKEWKEKNGKNVKPELQRGMSKSNSSDNNDFTHREHKQEERYFGTRFERSNSPKTKGKLTFDKPDSNHLFFSTSLPAQGNQNGKTENVDYVSTEITSKKVPMASRSKKIDGVKSDRNYQPEIKEENNSPASSYTKTSSGSADKSLLKGKILKKTDTVVALSRISDDVSPVILAQELHLNEGESNANFDASNEVMLWPKNVKAAGNFSAKESQLIRKENDTSVPQRFPCVKKDEINPTSSNQKTVPNQQVKLDGIDSLRGEYADGQFSFVNASPMITNEGKFTSVVPNSNTDSSDGVNSNQQEEGNNSTIFPDPMIREQTNEVNVCIDYRNKRPVSIEYSDEDISFLTTLGSSARASRKVKRNSSAESRIKTIKNRSSCGALDAENVIPAKQFMKNSEEVCRSRLSRKDKHESDIMNRKLKNLQKDKCQLVPVSNNHQLSPEPYRRDNTIVYTDARTSFGSDTDSISRDSTISSSGSDMTVILQEDIDISVDDLRQLKESGSKIGIDIAPIVVETGDDLLEGSSDILTEMPPAMELSKTLKNYQKSIVENGHSNPKSILTKETVHLRENSPSIVHTDKSNFSQRFIDLKNSERLSSHYPTPSNSNVSSACSSVASSRASSKTTVNEGSEGKNSSKSSEGGKGFFSKLKSFRSSFRAKKSDHNSFDKKGKLSKNSQGKSKEHNIICNENGGISRQFSPNTDNNSNVSFKHRNRTKSDTRIVNTKSSEALSRRSYDALRHPNISLRDVVAARSVSSDHLNRYRVTSAPNFDEMNAKSLEVLVETCI